MRLAVALALLALLPAFAGGQGTPAPVAADGLLVVHVTQSRTTGAWTERATLRVCAAKTSRPDITHIAVAASKPCPK